MSCPGVPFVTPAPRSLRVLALVLACASAAALSACGGGSKSSDNGSGSGTAPPPAAAPNTLSRTPTIANGGALYELQLSTDGGSTWTTVDTGVSGYGHFTTSSCKGSGSKALCIAGGAQGSTFAAGGVVVVSADGGATWTIPTLPLSPYAQVLGVDCAGAGTTGVCAAGGFYEDSGTPFLIASSDGGATWQLQTPLESEACFFATGCQPNTPGSTWPTYFTIQSVPISGQAAITGISCFGSAPNASCYASALSYSGLDYPFVLTSTDGLASSWNVATGLPQTQRETFLGIACAPVGTSTTCVAVGQVGTGTNESGTSAPVIWLSADAGVTWTQAAVPTPPAARAWYSAASYTGSGSSVVWTVTGTATASDSRTITATSTDGGKTWN
jgi:hypothetical protein